MGSVGGYALYLASTFDNATTQVDGALTVETNAPKPTYTTAHAPQNILLLGSDTRGKLGTDPDAEGNRSDVMMFLHISGDRKSVQIMSIPRDTWVDIPCYGKGKINWAMSYGGVTCAVQTVEKFLDTKIDHFVLINFAGVKQLTEILNGVTVDNPRAFTSDVNDYEHNHYFFPAGPLELRGAQALAFVRERHAFPDGDISRALNQQLFVTAVINKIVAMGLFTSPGTMSQLAASIGQLLIVDPGLDSSWIVKTAVELTPFDSSHVSMFLMPVAKSQMIGSQYAIIPNESELGFIKGLLSKDALSGYIPVPQPAVDAMQQNG